MIKITIIGANSYIARNLIHILEKKPEKYQLKLYGRAKSHLDNNPNYTSVNIFEKDSVHKIDFNCNLLFVFIGRTGSNAFGEYCDFIKVNEIALLNILCEYVEQKSTAKIVFPSTRLVYRGMEGKLNEDSEKEFKSIYAVNKYSCEKYLEIYNRVYGVKYCIFRICIPYGTFIANAVSYGTAEIMLNKARKHENIVLYGDGSQRRTLTYIGDLCNIMILGAESENCCNDVYNIGGEDYSLYEMAEMISERYKVGIECIDWPEIAKKTESGSTVFDDTKLKEKLLFEYNMKFEQWAKQEDFFEK